MINASTHPGMQTPSAQRGIRVTSVILWLFLLYLVGAHLRLSLYSGGQILMPMYLMLTAAGLLSMLHLRQLANRAGLYFVCLALFILVQPTFSTAEGSELSNTLKGALQLLVSIISAFAVLYALSRIERQRFRRLLLVGWIIICVLAVLENVGLKPVFDQIRDTLYAGSGRFVYSAELRDLEIYGKVRTTVFASEPSFLADTLSVLILLVFFLDPSRGRLACWARLGGMILISFYLSPSFKMLFYILAAMVWHFWPRTTRSLAWGLLISSFIAFLFVLLRSEFVIFLETALGRHLSSGSFFGRIAVAPDVVMEALKSHPLFGFGIGNEDGAYTIISNAWLHSGAFYRFPWYQDLPASDLMSNGFAWQWVFMGVLGTLIFYGLLLVLMRRFGIAHPMRTLTCAWIVWYAGSAFVDPQSWLQIVVFGLGALSIPDKGQPSHHDARISNG